MSICRTWSVFSLYLTLGCFASLAFVDAGAFAADSYNVTDLSTSLGGGGGGGGGGEDDPDDFEDYDFDEVGSAFLGSTLAVADSNVGYIDSAIIRSQLRLRFDAYSNFDEPDRAEYFYSTWTTFGGRTNPATTGPNDSIDSQTMELYYEQALTCRFSAFVEGKVVFNDPSGNPGPGPNESGIGDMVAGFKWLAWERCDQLVTFQVKNYINTGSESKWLTAGHYSVEPAILYFNRLSDRWTMEAEIRDWIAVGGANNAGTPYAGNVLRYGVGLSYVLVDNCRFRVTPVLEVVGWSVLEGQKFAFNPNGPVDADGDNIVNLKLGARLARCGGWGDFYAGWGTALTSEKWYENIARLDYRILF